MSVVQIVLFTTKVTKDTKGSMIKISNFVHFVSFVVKTFFTVSRKHLNLQRSAGLTTCVAPRCHLSVDISASLASSARLRSTPQR